MIDKKIAGLIEDGVPSKQDEGDKYCMFKHENICNKECAAHREVVGISTLPIKDIDGSIRMAPVALMRLIKCQKAEDAIIKRLGIIYTLKSEDVHGLIDWRNIIEIGGNEHGR